MATLAPQELLSEPPTTYRRWWNNSWFAVEEGGQRKAGEWTPADEKRLGSLVDYAHKLGYWIRFYTLNGHTEEEAKGWDANYNFGSREAVQKRWKDLLLGARVNRDHVLRLVDVAAAQDIDHQS